MEQGQLADEVSREISNRIWQACDTFRGIVDPAHYKDYIITMLFLRYVSDHFTENHSSRQDFVIPPGTNFRDLYQQRDSPHLGALINHALTQLEQANLDYLAGVLCSVDFDSEANLGDRENRNRRLRSLLENFQQLGVTFHDAMVHGDSIGNAYIYLIERFAANAGKKAGEFYTPHTLANLMARLSDPQPGNSICDPACGSGSLLLEMAKHVAGRNCQLFGMEINNSTWALAKMNMFLNAVPNARIERCDTLTAPTLFEKKECNGVTQPRLMTFDRVVANPPFSLAHWGRDQAAQDPFNRYWRGLPPAHRGDWAFISHMIEAAKPGEGKITAIVSHGVLFRGGSEKKIRAQVVEENLIDSVIGLPPNLFPSTAIPVAILVLDRTREPKGVRSRCRDVLFIDASHISIPLIDTSKKHRKDKLDHKIVEKIEQIYCQRKPIPGVAALVPIQAIREHDFNLNIPLYVSPIGDHNEPDLATIQQAILQQQQELEQINQKIARYLDFLAPNQQKNI